MLQMTLNYCLPAVTLTAGNSLMLSADYSFLALLAGGLMLVAALSIDAFAASFGYGASGIKVSFLPALIISVIGSGVLAFAMLIGSLIGRFLPLSLTKAVCCVLLLIMGVLKLSDSLIKRYIQKHQSLEKSLNFRFLSLHFILKIYADPTSADNDKSKTLSAKESVMLALALSLDSLAVGIGAGAIYNNLALIAGLSLLLTLAAIYLGGFLGVILRRKVSKGKDLNLAWISGVILIALAIFKLVS